MKVLVATKETQGQRKNDFSWTDEGEMVCFGFECDGETVDGNCGCKRALCGMTSHKATTTMRVADLPISFEEYAEALRTSLEEGGWVDKGEGQDWAESDALELLRIAGYFPAGTVIEKRGSKYQERR